MTAVTASDCPSADTEPTSSGLPFRAVFTSRPSVHPNTILAVRDADDSLLDPIRSLGAQLWVTELAPLRPRQRRLHVDGWISDWRHRRAQPGTSVGFAFELDGADVLHFRLLFHGRTSSHPEVTSVRAAVRKLQVAVKLAQGRIVLVAPEPAQPFT